MVCFSPKSEEAEDSDIQTMATAPGLGIFRGLAMGGNPMWDLSDVVMQSAMLPLELAHVLGGRLHGQVSVLASVLRGVASMLGECVQSQLSSAKEHVWGIDGMLDEYMLGEAGDFDFGDMEEYQARNWLR